MLKTLIWRMLYGRWRPMKEERQPGYTMMLLVPGDLPVFTHIAMQVCAAQDGEGLFETLIIPDQVTSGLQACMEKQPPYWPHGVVRVTPLRLFDQWLANWMRNPHTNCWLQLLHGVENTLPRQKIHCSAIRRKSASGQQKRQA